MGRGDGGISSTKAVFRGHEEESEEEGEEKMTLRNRRRGEKRTAEALKFDDVKYQTAVRHVFDWQHNGVRHFYTELLNLMCRADEQNMLRLALAFPQHALAFHQWRTARTEREFFEQAGFLTIKIN